MIIPLTQGQVAEVDEEDYFWLSQWDWYAMASKSTGSFYAVRRAPSVNGKQGATIHMHREVAGAQPGQEVDHGDHGTLNNRRHNLTLTTHQGNAKNRRLTTRNTSGVCGVSWCRFEEKWRAYIKINGKAVSLGYYIEKADAIAARQVANVKYGFHENHGESCPAA